MKPLTHVGWMPAVLPLLMAVPAEPCTIAVASGSVTTDGRPLLWKNRDLNLLDQEVRYFDDGLHGGYIALVSTDDNPTTTAYVGLNDAGFAIMNSNAPDIATSSPSSHGIFMKRALRECVTVDDFETLLVATSGQRGHIWANFGVIDALGNATMFEANDREYRRYDASSQGGVVVRANASVWGGGYLGSRFERAATLIGDAVEAGELDHRYLVQTVARDIGGPPSMPCGEWSTADPALSRYRTRSSVVVHGVLPGEDPRLSTFWCTLGEPSCGVAVPVWSCAGDLPPELLSPDGTAPMCREIQEKELTAYASLTNDTTIDTDVLVGEDGAGGIHRYSLSLEIESFDEVALRLEEWRRSFPSTLVIARFQALRAGRTYRYFDEERPPEDPGAVVRAHALADLPVVGTVAGSCTDTWLSDDVRQTITEVPSVDHPHKTTGMLDHIWRFQVTPGSAVIFRVEASRPPSAGGDDFRFGFSTDDHRYTPLVLVADGDERTYSASLPPSTSGPVYVRVRDTDDRWGEGLLDALLVDYLVIETVGAEEPSWGSLHVEDIALTRSVSGPHQRGVATITIHDDGERPVPGATVRAIATGPVAGVFRSVTGPDGTVRFTTGKAREPVGEWCFEITDAAHQDLVYDASGNHLTRACESRDDVAGGPVPFVLGPAMPDPFNPATELTFSLPVTSPATLRIFDVRGRLVATLVEGIVRAGDHRVRWDAGGAASGVYFYRLDASGLHETRRMTLAR